MTKHISREEYEKGKTAQFGDPGISTAEEAFQKATALHQQGDVFRAQSLYNLILDRFPGSPKAELVKTMIAGLQKEKIGILWDTAAEARSNCNTDEAVKLYRLIIADFPDSAEAKNAAKEIANLTEILRSWNAALEHQSKGNETKASELYKQIIDRFPESPEAGNAGLISTIIRQNQFMPAGQVIKTTEREDTPEKIISHLLSHKKASCLEAVQNQPQSPDEEIQRTKIDKLWTQSAALEKDGQLDEAALLYRQIIDSSPSGYRVRDAKYRLTKLDAISKDFILTAREDKQEGLAQKITNAVLPNLFSYKAAIAAVLLLAAITGAVLYYRSHHQLSWTDAVQQAKKAVVVVRTAGGSGTGFLVSSDGLIFTSSNSVGKDKDVDVRLSSGESKKAVVMKVGVKPLDIAVLKIDGAYDQYLPMTLADDCKEGEEIRAIGTPSGREFFVTKGIISHCNQDHDGVKYIQTDLAITLENSGGPCINKAGHVIGLSTSLRLGDDAQKLSLVLPISVVKDFFEGKLAALEETFLKREEERTREIEQNKQQFYADAETTFKRLQSNADREYAGYTAKLDNLIRMHVITYDQGKLMVERVRYAPSGSGTISDWLQSLTLRIVKGELSEEGAVKLIKDHYKL